ncbi:hypothetical protein CPB84DRAFT_1745544 [Gymnopilus junonius]|uniref:Glucose-methanol-choline oxidoreductase N-terminal domain-containing protein n=1 Tax=Gymnopilus junonius TaxID=109634 RepID=A0A9P5TPD2_GYMJU|nr:hypothetical protein CPB84DRAFT_1745544 [Gymnopilus junonius]
MPFITIEDVVRCKAFDYVVIGGGIGLATAVCLSEDPSATVLVLEAGASESFEVPNIDIPAQGTSAINAYIWSKLPAVDISAFKKLSNLGWNWKDYHEYSKKLEIGKLGPVQVAIAPHVHTIDKLFQEMMVQKGLKKIDDPYGGNITGTWMAASSLDPKISSKSLGCTATSIEFVQGRATREVKVDKEVILSTGIGQPEVLFKIGIDIVINLPGIGENAVQEHIFVTWRLRAIALHGKMRTRLTVQLKKVKDQLEQTTIG